MQAGPFDLAIELRSEAGERLGVVAASLGACLEHALWQAVRAGAVPNDGRLPAFAVVPQFGESGGPAITGLGLRLPGGGREERFALAVFAAQARAAIQGLLAAGRVEEDAVVTWSVLARPRAAPPAAPRAELLRAPYPLRPAALPELPAGGTELCVEAPVLRRALALFGAVERAALLLGAVLHDAERGAVRLHVSDVVEIEPGPGGASDSHFAFRPEDFAAARRLARERRDGALPCGWLHTHPACAACAEAPACRTDTIFFSADDVDVHAAAFPSPFAVALVAGKAGARPATQPALRAYGWRAATIGEIGLRIVGPGAEHWRRLEDGAVTEEAR